MQYVEEYHKRSNERMAELSRHGVVRECNLRSSTFFRMSFVGTNRDRPTLFRLFDVVAPVVDEKSLPVMGDRGEYRPWWYSLLGIKKGTSRNTSSNELDASSLQGTRAVVVIFLMEFLDMLPIPVMAL